MYDKCIIFFVIYGFLGYVWEVLYVSLRQGKLCNRGFLHGPVLPIYGFGAIAIIGMTTPFKDNMLQVFLAGCVGATTLEYFTGEGMLRLFKVRYWDYSNAFANVKGYICLKASLTWGMFSVVALRWLHPAVQSLTELIPESLLEPLSHILVILLTIDATWSFRTAMDLRVLLEELLKDEDENGIPDILEVIPSHLREKRQRAKERLQTLLHNHPSARFETRMEGLIHRIRTQK